MTQQEQVARFVKAATTGFAHALAHKGYSTEEIGKASTLYAHPQGGLLSKRASAVTATKDAIRAHVQTMRAAH